MPAEEVLADDAALAEAAAPLVALPLAVEVEPDAAPAVVPITPGRAPTPARAAEAEAERAEAAADCELVPALTEAEPFAVLEAVPRAPVAAPFAGAPVVPPVVVVPLTPAGRMLAAARARADMVDALLAVDEVPAPVPAVAPLPYAPGAPIPRGNPPARAAVEAGVPGFAMRAALPQLPA